MIPTVWLDRSVPEDAIVDPCVRAGWVRATDRPRTTYGARLLRYEPREGGGGLTLASFAHEGCQAVVLHGELDARHGPVWDAVVSLPRYDGHEADAVALDPARRIRGLRQWCLQAISARIEPWWAPGAPVPERSPAFEAALAAAREDVAPVVRLAAEGLTELLSRVYTDPPA